MKALIIEPATSYQLVLSSILGEFHIESICAKNGTDALELLNDNEIDLVCSAIHLSDMTGIDLCKTIRVNNQGCHNLPIIVISSEENKTLLTEALKGGATRTFHKHDLELFSAYIRDFISHEHHEHRHLKGDVLYIEDCKVTSSLVISVLEESELNVTHHDTAEAALTALSDGNYDLVITDLGLGSGMSGAELVETLRGNPTHELLPILVVTADTKVERRIELLENGVNDYICKPVIPNELIARSINLIKSKKLYDKVEHQRQALREMAMKDQLTGLYNRHFLMEIGPKKVNQALEKQSDLSLIVIDLDKFKSINDTHGHATGDIVLASVGKLLREHCQTNDHCIRFGGEEFVLILADKGLSDASQIAERYRTEIEALKPANLTVTASFGVSALLHQNDQEIGTIFARADQAAYESKKGGRNQVSVNAS